MPAAPPDPDALSDEANRLVRHAAATGDLAGFDAAIQRYATVVAITPAGHQHLGIRLSNLAYGHFLRYSRGGADEDAVRAVQAGEQAAAAVHAGDQNTALILSNLAAVHLMRYQRVARPGDLDRAIQLGEQVLRSPGADAFLPTYLGNLAAGHLLRYEGTGRVADLDLAVRHGERAVDAGGTGDHNRATVLNNLATAHRYRYNRTGHRGDLDRSIDIGELAVAEGPDTENADTVLANLGIAYHDRFERTGDLPDLDRCIHHHERAVAATPADDPEHPTRLSNLATAQQARYQRLGDVADLDRAIGHMTRAVAATPAGHRLAATFVANLGVFRSDRFDRLGELADLHEAIHHKERAVLATPEDHPQLAYRLSNLALSYQARFERVGDPADLDRSVDRLTASVDATPRDHPDLPRHLTHLGGQLRTRFEERGDLADLDLAVRHHAAAVAITPGDLPELAARLSMLGLAHSTRYSRTGDLADLDRSVTAARRSVEHTPPDHPDLPLRLTNLASAVRARYLRTGTLADLDEAVARTERAVATLPSDHAARALHLSNLGQALHSRFQRTGTQSDLARAVEVTEEALGSTPADHPARVLRLGNLGRLHLSRFEHGRSVTDLDTAAALVRAAADAVPATHPDHPRYRYHVAVVERARFTHTGDLADLDRAIDTVERAVALLPAGHPSLGGHLYLLGSYHLHRHHAGGAVDAGRVAALAEQALAATTARPLDRLHACWAAGRLAFVTGAVETARRLMDTALSVLPLIAARESARADQEYRLGANRGLVGETIAVHCASDDPAGAVRAAEQGRAILLAQALDLRTPLATLAARHPARAERYRQARDALDAPDSGPDLRATRWAEHDRALAEVRALPGFARFLLPPEWTELLPAAAGGAVVLLNAARQRCDGIVVTPDGPPVRVPLPDLRLADAERWVVELTEATTAAGAFAAELRRQRVLGELLSWLWDTAVGPVLAALPAGLDRVWWLPTGPLGLLPVHAAGRPGEPGALDRVVSSYTPTLRALARTRARPATAVRRQLVVALDRTPGLPDLPATAAEAAGLHSRHPDRPPLTNDRATVAAVTTALSGVSWAHFACHAGSEPDTPSAGGLHLHDGLLPVAEVGRRDLPDAELAYLSACSTGHAGRRHADESIHLASAFQLAGFRHVIASLWPLDDRVGAGAADRFYRLLPDLPSADQSALTLHRVVRELRAEHPTRPHLWASLIHSGP
jgi:hypothetical protein